jgi:hypothetical protein
MEADPKEALLPLLPPPPPCSWEPPLNCQSISFRSKIFKMKHFSIITLKSIHKFVSYNVKIMNSYSNVFPVTYGQTYRAELSFK